MESNLILYLPFDNPDDYGKAFDYSASRADAVLSGEAFLTKDAKIGKALNINGTGECISPIEIPFTSDWTLSMYVKSDVTDIGWMLNFSELDTYYDFWTEINANNWNFLVFVRSGNDFIAYVNGIIVDKYTISNKLVGFSINDTMLSDSNIIFDEVKLYDSAVTHSDVLKIQYQSQSSDVEYYINGINFKDFGVYVSDSSGIIGIPERKEPLIVDWGTYHGVVVDRKRPRFKERTITLECFIEAENKNKFAIRVLDFISQFTKEDTIRLSIEYSGKTLPLLYEVMCMNAADVNKKWKYNDELMVGTFTLMLIEYEPVKRILRHIGGDSSTASITVTSSKLLNIYWGDGTYTHNVSGKDKTVEHIYEKAGEYDIVISGVIEDIANFSTNCIVIWQQLM